MIPQRSPNAAQSRRVASRSWRSISSTTRLNRYAERLVSQGKRIAQNINHDYIYIFLSHTIWQIAAKSDVGDVVEGKFPGGGRTRLSSIGSHNVGQMWLDR